MARERRNRKSGGERGRRRWEDGEEREKTGGERKGETKWQERSSEE